MAVKIRHAVEADIQTLVYMVEAMSVESPRYHDKPFSARKTANLIVSFLNGQGGFVAELDGEVIGMIAGKVMQSLTHDYNFSADVGVYVIPNQRGGTAFMRLVRAWEQWCWDNGADEVNLGISTEVHADVTVDIYSRMGYKLSAHSMVKYKKDK